MDLKKEIKLSDLFRRNGKESTNGADEGMPEEPTELKPKRRLFSRPPKNGDGPVEPNGNGKLGAASKTAPPVPQIPLMRAFDLLPKEQRRQESERRPGLVQIGIALVAVVVMAALGALFLMSSSSVNGKRQERDTLAAQLSALQAQAAEKPSADGGAELAEERVARTNALGIALSGRVAWDRLLRDVSLVLPSEVYLTALTAQSPTPASAPTAAASSTTQFAISGTTGRQENVALLLSRLSILPELSGVKLVSALRGEQDDVVFTINAVVRHEAATQ
jgi:Tfp pilus assembly protein PilN